MELRPVYRQHWSDDEGYADSDELIGYAAVDPSGTVLAYGDTREEALEAGLEASWQNGGDAAAVAVAR